MFKLKDVDPLDFTAIGPTGAHAPKHAPAEQDFDPEHTVVTGQIIKQKHVAYQGLGQTGSLGPLVPQLARVEINFGYDFTVALTSRT